MKNILIIVFSVISINVFGQSMHGMTYNMAFGVGETGDYIGKYSWRGFGIDGKYFLSDNMTLGWSTGWNVLYEGDDELQSYNDGSRTRTGKQYRYLNVFPALLVFDYFLNSDGEIQPFFGLGAGTYWIEQKTTMGLFSSTDDNWHFALAPEVGVLFPMNLRSNFYISAKYNQAFKTSNSSMNISFVGVNVGFLWY